MEELKKIKAIDPNLEIFNEVFGKSKGVYELRRQMPKDKLRS